MFLKGRQMFSHSRKCRAHHVLWLHGKTNTNSDIPLSLFFFFIPAFIVQHDSIQYGTFLWSGYAVLVLPFPFIINPELGIIWASAENNYSILPQIITPCYEMLKKTLLIKIIAHHFHNKGKNLEVYLEEFWQHCIFFFVLSLCSNLIFPIICTAR